MENYIGIRFAGRLKMKLNFGRLVVVPVVDGYHHRPFCVCSDMRLVVGCCRIVRLFHSMLELFDDRWDARIVRLR